MIDKQEEKVGYSLSHRQEMYDIVNLGQWGGNHNKKRKKMMNLYCFAVDVLQTQTAEKEIQRIDYV